MKQLLSVFFISLSLMFVGLTAHAQLNGAGGSAFVQEYVYDFAVEGGAVGFKSLLIPAQALPVGGVVTSAHYQILTPFLSAGAATVSIGDSLSTARHKALTAYNDSSYTLNVPVALSTGIPNYVSAASVADFGIAVSGAALTAGKLRIVVQGYKPKGQ